MARMSGCGRSRGGWEVAEDKTVCLFGGERVGEREGEEESWGRGFTSEGEGNGDGEEVVECGGGRDEDDDVGEGVGAAVAGTKSEEERVGSGGVP
uniref:Uncharacterized protein n=1 Tax=Cucumis sativus TaxID=3659 RepID=A0A0A0KN82_CUCSA